MSVRKKSASKASPRKRVGRPELPIEPDLTPLDADILRLAGQFKVDTGKTAARGAIGRRFTNQGGPFVRFAAGELGKTETDIIARIKRLERHPRLSQLWKAYRTPARITFAAFLKSQED
jgi:hypothetical protein